MIGDTVVLLSDSQFADLMMCLGFGLGCLFWSFVYFIIFRK